MSEIKITSENGSEIIIDERGFYSYNKPTSKIIEELQQENKELKETLKGTTHCYDEQEHRKLKERIEYLERSNNRREDTILEYRMNETPILNELESWLKKRIKSFEDRIALGQGYELTEVMQIELVCDRRYLNKLKELRGDNNV